MDRVVQWQKFEGAVIFVAGLWLFLLDGSYLTWWMAVLVFFSPDLSFAGYLLGSKAGAFIYNMVHIYALGAIFIVLGMALDLPAVGDLGALWLAHSGFDRMFGYGLKSTKGFARTHLGQIGKATGS